MARKITMNGQSRKSVAEVLMELRMVSASPFISSIMACAGIRGESRLSSDLLNELVSKTKGEVTELSVAVEAEKQELNAHTNSAQQEQQEFEKLKSWADLYDNCTFAAKKMIVSQFIKAVYVYRDYTIEVEFNISFDEFKSLSTNCTNEGNEKATVYPVSEEKDRLAI